MVTDSKSIGLVVGNYCHDVLHRDGKAVADTLGGAASFISVVLDSLSIPFDTVSKVGPDFAYAASTSNHPPITIPSSQTTLFHAHFGSAHPDRLLIRVRSCHPILPSDLPDQPSRFGFGLAVGVAGEILPETLERMLSICDHVFVDIQALIRRFDNNGRVSHVSLRDTAFFHLLPRIAFLKASADEAAFIDVQEIRKWCCVVVTHGKHGCDVFSPNAAFKVPPFQAHQLDPTGAGDCFLGGFAAAIVRGLALPDAALLGNFFGSLAVSQVGPPNLAFNFIQMIKEEIHKRKLQNIPSLERRDELSGFLKPPEQDQFYSSLVIVKSIIMCQIQESGRNLLSSPKTILSLTRVHEEPIQSVDGKP